MCLILFIPLFSGFVTGFGLETQDTCRTNGRGPEIYTTCAPGSIIEHKGKTEKIRHYKENWYGQKVWAPGCISGYAPTKLYAPCYGFNYLYVRVYKNNTVCIP